MSNFSLNSKKNIIPLIFLGVIFLCLQSMVFIVDQTKQALILQFGECKTVHTEPGLKLKLPFIQDVLLYEKRVLDVDLPPIQITTHDQKRLIVDTYTRYRIDDTLKFFQSIRPANEEGARIRLEVIISSSIRNVLGKVDLRTLLSAERAKIMKLINDEISKMVAPLGMAIVDVRIIRTELPPENRKAVFARMNSDLIRFAKENRAKGDEIAQTIRSKADRDRTILLAQAYKQSQILKGEGDGRAIEISSAIYGKDPSFYEFYRSLESYRSSFSDKVQFVMSTNLPYLQNFNSFPAQ